MEREVQGLSYAARRPCETRESRLATTAIVATVVCSPCVVVPVVGWLNHFVPLPGRIAVALMLLPIIVAVTAIVRIRLSGGRLVGLGWALVGLALSVLQLGLSFVLSYFMGGRLGPGD